MALHSVTSTGRPSSRARTPSGDILSSRSRRPARTARPQTGLAMARRRPRAALRRAVTPKITCRVHEGSTGGIREVHQAASTRVSHRSASCWSATRSPASGSSPIGRALACPVLRGASLG
jgi:hypothetical protein